MSNAVNIHIEQVKFPIFKFYNMLFLIALRKLFLKDDFYEGPSHSNGTFCSMPSPIFSVAGEGFWPYGVHLGFNQALFGAFGRLYTTAGQKSCPFNQISSI